MKAHKITLILATIFLLIKTELHAQEIYTYSLVDNGLNSFTVRATPKANLVNLNSALQSYGFTIILPDGVKASISSSIGNGASATFFNGDKVGNSAIDGYLISEKLESTILLPTASNKGIIDLVTIQVNESQNSEAIYILNNNSKLATSTTALMSFVTADIVDNSISQFKNVVNSKDSESSRLLTSEKDELRSLSMYPNPTSGELHIELLNTSDQIEILELFNIEGRLVWKDERFKGQNINISNLQNGVYFIKVNTTNKNSITKKIIKK